MKKTVDGYVKKQRKQTIKLLKKMFDISSIAEAIKKELELKSFIESVLHKEIDLISWCDIKSCETKIYVTYAKYLTLKSIIDSHIDNSRFYTHSQDLMEFQNEMV